MIRIVAILIGGPRYWLLPLLPLPWLAMHMALLAGGVWPSIAPAAAQPLIGIPLAVIGMFLGGRIIAGELDQNRLEIAYTVPGGAHRVWLVKLAAAGLILALALILAALVTFIFLTAFPMVQTLYGAAQGCIFYLAAAMGWSTLLRSETAGAMATVVTFGLEFYLTVQFGGSTPILPFWNPLIIQGVDGERLLAMAVQNRIGIALLTAVIVALTFARAERREAMLGG